MLTSIDGAERRIASEARLLFVLVIATALGPMAMQIFVPALPSIQDDHQVSAAAAQLTFSLSALAMAVATLLYGPISDRFGRRPTMLGGLLVFLVGSLVCAVAGSIHLLILGRIIQAGGGCVGMVLARAVVRDIYDREHAATMLAWITMAMVVAPMVSPAIGGVLIDHLGWPFVFVFGGFLGVLVLISVWNDLPETAPRIGAIANRGAMFGNFAVLLRSNAFLGYAGQGAFSISVFFGFLAAAPYLMVKVYGRPAFEYGLLFILVSGAFMLGNFTAARLTRRFGIEGMVLVGSAGSLLGCTAALVLAMAGVWTPLGLFLPMAFGAFAQGIAMPNTQAAVVSVRPDLAGSASGLAGFVQMGTAALAAQLIGSIQTATPYPLAIGITLFSSLALACAVVATRAPR